MPRPLLVLAVLCAACAGHTVRLYDGPERPRAEVAVLVMGGKGLHDDDGPDDLVCDAYLLTADGRPLNRATVLEVLPGRYEVEVHWSWYDHAARSRGARTQPYWEGRSTFTFTAKAGGSYELDWDYWKQGAPTGIRKRR